MNLPNVTLQGQNLETSLHHRSRNNATAYRLYGSLQADSEHTCLEEGLRESSGMSDVPFRTPGQGHSFSSLDSRMKRRLAIKSCPVQTLKPRFLGLWAH